MPCAGKAALAGYVFTTIDYPGATFTVANGINSTGQIVGSINGTRGGGFLYSGGSFSTINYPGLRAYGTVANGINDCGQIVGYFQEDTGVQAFL